MDKSLGYYYIAATNLNFLLTNDSLSCKVVCIMMNLELVLNSRKHKKVKHFLL